MRVARTRTQALITLRCCRTAAGEAASRARTLALNSKPVHERNRTISLTATKKKGLEFKQNLITEVRETFDQYDNLFIISMFNQRNLFLKDLRQQWADSKFLFGKNKVISLAFGRSIESEYKENLSKLIPHLAGNIGLLFTNRTKDEVLKFFSEFSCPDYARAGNISTEDVTLTAGPLEQFQHTMEPQLRKLGLHTSLKKGIVTLDTDFLVCKKGDKLTADQARLLKLFETMQATFKVNVKLYWTKSGEMEVLDTSVEENIEEDQDDIKNEDADENNNTDQQVMETENVEPEEPKNKKLKKKNKKSE